MIEVTKSERKELLQKAYENGYNYFQYSLANIEEIENFHVVISETHGDNSLSQTYRHIEDYFGFERGKNDWDNYGIYGIIEDSCVCYEKGAKDALEGKEFNPKSVKHMWDY